MPPARTSRSALRSTSREPVRDKSEGTEFEGFQDISRSLNADNDDGDRRKVVAQFGDDIEAVAVGKRMSSSMTISRHADGSRPWLRRTFPPPARRRRAASQRARRAGPRGLVMVDDQKFHSLV